MRCPNCHASNYHVTPPTRKGRGYAGWQNDDRSAPTIILHPDCQNRFTGTGVVCDGCYSMFNCLTGNIDDGAKIEERTETAPQVSIKEIEQEDKAKKLNLLQKSLLISDFSYVGKDNILYAKYKGTIWKLDKDDIHAIINNTWDTDKTKVIKNSLKELAEKASIVLRG